MMIFITTRVAVDKNHEENYSELQEKRINEAKEKLRKILWHKYHKQIRWHIGEWLQDRSQPWVLVCDIDADIDV